MPKFRVLNRKLHRWGAVAIGVPFLVVICSGILLQLKKQIPWVQPREHRGTDALPTLALPQILQIAQSAPEAGIRSWDDVERIDVRPDKRLLKVIAKSRWEIQMDLGSGRILQVAYRRSDLIESLHDGSFFHPRVKLFVFLPVGVIVLGLWATGVYLFVLPHLARRARTRSIVIVLTLTATAAGAAGAQGSRDSARADTTRRLPDLEVRGVRPLITTGGSAAVRVRLDSLALPAAPTLEEVMRQIPLLHVRRNSRGEAEISARGSESRQVAILQDGIPLTLAWDARADASVLPTAGLTEVHFIRGFSSMLYGPNVLGGIIEMPVGHASYRPAVSSLTLSSGLDGVGGFGGQGAVIVPVGGAVGRWLFRAGVGFRDSPGVPLAKNVVEPIPGKAGLRVNTDASSREAFAALRYQKETGEFFSVSASTFKARRGIAAELGFNGARFWRYPDINRTVAVLSGGFGHHRSPVGGMADIEASIGVDVGRTEIDTYTGRDYATVNGFEDGKDRTLTLRMLADHTLGARGELRTAWTLADTRHDEFLPAGEARYRQQLMSIGAETVWRLIDQRRGINALRLSLGGAYDVGKTPETGGREPGQPTLTGLGARVGMTLVAADGRLLAHAGISRRGRFPSLRELYSGALARFTPNPDLKPETLVAAEAGITARFGSTSEVQVVGFRHQMNDAVIRIALPDRSFKRVNRNRLNSAGIEILASTMVGLLALGGDLTVQRVDLTNTDANITNRPENLPGAFGGAYARAMLPLRFRAGAQARYTGNQFCIDPATGTDAKLESGAVFSADVSREFRLKSSGGWLSRFEARIAADNLGNKAMYDQCRLPEAGRQVRLQGKLY